MKTAAILVGLWLVLIVPVTLLLQEIMGPAGRPIAAWITLAIVWAVWFFELRPKAQHRGERTPGSTS